jgi:hypothetical protein
MLSTGAAVVTVAAKAPAITAAAMRILRIPNSSLTMLAARYPFD